MKEKDKSQRRGLGLGWASAGTAIVLASFHLSDPLTGDAIWFWTAVQRVLNMLHFDPSPVMYEIFHPPTYLYCLAASVKLFGLSPYAFYGVNLVFFLATLFLLWKVSGVVYQGHEEKETLAGFICFLYALNPFVIQGILAVDIDNTILPVALLLFTHGLIRGPIDRQERRRTLGLGFLFALALWVKPTTTLSLPFIMVFWLWKQVGPWQSLKRSFLVFLWGAILFLGTYLLFSKSVGISLSEMFKDYARQFALRADVSFLSNVNLREFGFFTVLARRFLRVVLWIGPFLTLATLFAFWERSGQFLRKKKVIPEDFLWGFAFLIAVVYTFFGGPAFGFPKYHLPFFTFAVIPLGGFLYPFLRELRKEKKSRILLLGGACLLFQMLWVGDLLYWTDYGLRERLILDPGSVRPYLGSLTVRFCLLSVPPAFLFLFLEKNRGGNRGRRWMRSLLVAAVSQGFALNLLQAAAPYQTAFSYGAEGTGEMISFLKSNLPPAGKIFAPPDISHQLDFPRVDYEWFDENPESFRRDMTEILKEKEVFCFGYGISAATLRQNRLLREDRFQHFLSKRFVRHNIGSYTLWLRKE